MISFGLYMFYENVVDVLIRLILFTKHTTRQYVYHIMYNEGRSNT